MLLGYLEETSIVVQDVREGPGHNEEHIIQTKGKTVLA